MRIVFLGSPEYAIAPLERLLSHSDHEVVAVVSQPANHSGRGRKLSDPPVASFAKERGLNVLQPTKASNAEFLQEFRELKPDLAITVAYGQILNDEFLSIPKRGTINIHPSLLPRHRGATPVPAALLAGDRVSGVTIAFTVRKLDAGNTILREEFPFSGSQTAGALLFRLFELGAEKLNDALTMLEDPGFVGIPQDESQITHCGKIAKTDGIIDWSLNCDQILARFRAYHPWPGSYTFLSGTKISIEDLSVIRGRSEMNPGKVEFDKKEKVSKVAAGDGKILVHTLKPAGGKLIDASAFWNGLKDKNEVCFG